MLSSIKEKSSSSIPEALSIPATTEIMCQPVPCVHELSVHDFIQHFRIPRKPVLIKSATRNWQASSWTPELLREKVGHRQITIRTPQGPVSRQFGQLLTENIHSTPDQPAEYARNIDIERDLPELWQQVRPRIRYAEPDWKSSALLPKDFLFPNQLEELFIGGKGASFPRLHVDYYGMDGFVSQIYGKKVFYLVAPQDTPYVYADPKDRLTTLIPNINQVDLQLFPLFKQATLMKVLLEPGDTLYNPQGWWHTSYMPETSITIITATWHRNNWWEMMKQYKERSKHSKLAKICMLGYLAAVGGLLTMQEKIGL